MNFNSINLVKTHLINYPCPLNINFLWNYGFLLGIIFFIQILTGVFLASRYSPEISYAYYSIQHILRELWSGWCFRYMHATGASLVFFLTYLHILRGLNYSYLYLPLSWISGLIIFALFIVTAFIGYVLPWGQMSYWGATVITNLLSGIPSLVIWLCGGYTVSDPTIKRFFVLHFILPFVALCIVFIHIFFLHLHGSTNPLGYDTALKIPFYPNLLSLDVKGFNNILILFLIQSIFGVIPLSHPDNAIIVNTYVTPLQIVPEWYFLPFYAMLKTIPSKNAGLVIVVASLQLLFLLAEQRNLTTIIQFKMVFSAREYSVPIIWFMCSFYALLWIGCQLPQDIFILYGRLFIILFFSSGLFSLVHYKRTHYDYSSQANI
ncbi:cytochrome b (mitochondrion) [Plasmodium vinckei]|uniref:Cytochrome b n=7 Tax=Plasmodium (Vinckeia) TaxID=418101 RepID=F2Z9D8_PLAVN|nr:cytochrome b [Plasmodium vinckei vinckei]CAD2114654.1 cytochrome b [Plasmodium vinckei]CAD2114795.1 cytochrome b [Plasmodium vinckei petteri]